VATSRRFAAFLAERTADDAGDQFVELSIGLVVETVVRDATGRPRWAGDGEELLVVGGRWDRVARRWTDDKPARGAIIRITRGGAQERAARWLARWFRAHVTGDWPSDMLRPDRNDPSKLVRAQWSLLLLGGRRSGKSHLACAGLALFAVLYPGSIVWAVSPTQDETAELEVALRKMLPAAWYKYRGAGSGKVSTFTLQHGGQVLLLSGFKPAGLRRGRVDLVLFNEGQNMSHAGYVQLRAAIADTGGLVLIAANPPSAPIGRWIEEHKEGIMDKKIDGIDFDFNPEENPWVEIAALHSMAAEVDEITYDRDVLGLLRPIGDQVFHAWADRYNRLPVPPGFLDITEEVTRAHLGRSFPWVVGMDFQMTPHMAAAVLKFFRDPADPTNDVLTWAVGEVIAANANEDDLVTALECADRWSPDGYRESAGFAADECAVVMDASGWFQDGAHTRGRTSDLALKARGWRWLYKPQKDSDKNPDILERVKAANSRLKTKDQRRHMFVTPECGRIARAVKYWENRAGVPYRRSEYAHICDALTYPVYRFFGRPKKRGPLTYDRAPLPRANDLRGL
jgi:hypothetical protein